MGIQEIKRKNNMKRQIIYTGTKLLLGETLNNNSQYLESQFIKLGIGIDIYEISVFSDNDNDNKDHLVKFLKRNKSQLFFLNGGFGLTEEDVTRGTLSEFLSVSKIVCQKILDKIEKFCRKMNRLYISKNKEAANILEGVIIFYNKEDFFGLVIKNREVYFRSIAKSDNIIALGNLININGIIQ